MVSHHRRLHSCRRRYLRTALALVIVVLARALALDCIPGIAEPDMRFGGLFRPEEMSVLP